MSFIPLSESVGEYSDLSSSFIAYLYPLSKEEDFASLYEAIRRKNSKAAHIPYAFRLGEYEKCSDDGEPSGTAGRAALEAIKNRDIDQVAIILVRYFGGTKLGIPRLRRAFLEATNLALANAKYGQKKKMFRYDVEVDYPTYESIKRLSRKYGYSVSNENFGISVSLSLLSDGKIDNAFEALGLAANPPRPVEVECILEDS